MIFLDANYIVSYYIESEDHHKRALEIAKHFKDKKRIISKSIIAETVNILNTKLKIDKKIIKATYEKIYNDFKILEDHYYYDKAVDKIVNDKKRLPFFDTLYIVLMEDLGITEIATFDKHFNNIEGIKRIH